MRCLRIFMVSAVVVGCTNHVKPTWIDPTSFNLQIVCADGDGATTCPPVPVGAANCPAYTGPMNLGTVSAPVSSKQVHYIAQAFAVDHNAQPYAFNGTAGVYVMSDGSVSPPRAVRSDSPMPGGQPLPLALDDGTHWVQFTNGRACFGVTIPPSFNQTALWIEDVPYTSYDPNVPHSSTLPGHRVVSGSFAIGASQPIYRPSPLISDVTYTTDPVYTNSQLINKHVNITSGTDGAPIVVTYVNANYFTVTDLGAPGEDHAWGSLDVYSYSFPYGIQIGSVVTNVNGSVSPFDGLTELAFPIWTVVSATPDPDIPMPTPHEITSTDLTQTLTRMKPWESGVVVAKGWTVCALTGSLLTSFQKYQEWAVQPPPPPGCSPTDTSQACLVDCSNWQQSLEVVTNATVPSFNPQTNVGKKFCALTGVMTHVVPVAGIQLWIINPRDAQDLGTPVDPSTPCP